MTTTNGFSMTSHLPLSPADSGASPKKIEPQIDPQTAAHVAQDFEGVFASLVLKEMRKTLEPGSLFGEDSGDVYGGLFDTFLGQHLTQSGGFGLTRMVQESLQRPTFEFNPQPTGSDRADAALSIAG